MKFVEKELKETADASAARGHTAGEFFKLSLMTVALVVTMYFIVGDSVDLIVSRISVEAEKKIFSAFSLSKWLSEKDKDEEDKLASFYPILEKFIKAPEVPDLDYRLVLLDQKEPNAMAFPGGMIGITRGLLDTLDEDIAVAFIIGHELGHFKNRDHLRGLGRAVGMSVCYSLVFGGGSPSEVLTRNTYRVAERKYSRKQEASADRFGLELVYRLYGKTEGITRLFEILQKKDKTPEWAYMFSTHPSHIDRIVAMRRYAEELKMVKPVAESKQQ